MNKITPRRVADSLTWARVVSSVPITILALLGLRWWVVAVYVAAALTDVFDGVYAQRATDVPWFVTLVLLSSIAAKAQLAWYVVMQQRRIDAV